MYTYKLIGKDKIKKEFNKTAMNVLLEKGDQLKLKNYEMHYIPDDVLRHMVSTLKRMHITIVEHETSTCEVSCTDEDGKVYFDELIEIGDVVLGTLGELRSAFLRDSIFIAYSGTVETF